MSLCFSAPPLTERSLLGMVLLYQDVLGTELKCRYDFTKLVSIDTHVGFLLLPLQHMLGALRACFRETQSRSKPSECRETGPRCNAISMLSPVSV